VAITHLAKTHILMAGVVASAHRHVSQSHPVFKLLAPHFLYTMQTTKDAHAQLLTNGTHLDTIVSEGTVGALTLIRKVADVKMNVIDYLPDDLKSRGLDDLDVLPSYHSRNDAMLIHTAIEKYVNSYVSLYYTDQDLLHGDTEIQGWVREMATSRADGGLQISDLPGQGQMTNTDELAKLLTSIIYTSSVSHSLTNDAQFDEYGFIPSTPGIMRGTPPTSLDDVILQDDILASLPTLKSSMTQIMVTWLLSDTTTYRLGHFETDYVYDPQAVAVLEQFREDLKAVSAQIKERNLHRKSPYTILLPENVPNAISA